jgi:hypothetical protein
MSDANKKYNEMSASEKKKEDWMNTKWRPMMGWMYMVVCVTDFVFFPILWSMVQAIHDGDVGSQWQPITLQGAGLFHIAMGAIIGVTAFGRTQEKLNGANNGGIHTNTPMGVMGGPRTSSPYTSPTHHQPSYNTVPTPVTSAYSGRAAPPPAYQPEL